MAQRHWPVFPDQLTPITRELSVIHREGQVTYFHGELAIFAHEAQDLSTFWLITSQFCINGSAKQREIVRAFGVSPISVKRSVRRYREQGPAGFYVSRRQRGPAVLTPPVLAEAQALLDEGQSVKEVAQRLGLKANTLAKAARAGRVHHRSKKKSLSPAHPVPV